MALDNYSYYIIIIASFILAGVLKGATGAGAPIITIPVISAFYDVRLAVVLMVVPNFLSNIQKLYYFRKSILPLFTIFSFALGGGGGAFLGTIFLANLSLDILSFGVGIIVIIFISFKFFVPTWKLEYKKSKNLFFPFGFFFECFIIFIFAQEIRIDTCGNELFGKYLNFNKASCRGILRIIDPFCLYIASLIICNL